MMILAATLVALVSFGPAQDSGSGDARCGCWLEQGGTRTLLLGEGRSGWLVDGRPQFSRSSYTTEGATFESWGRETVFELRIEGEQLHVVGPDLDLLMERIERVPEALLVSPYELPEDVEVDEGLVSELTLDLLQRRAEDQRVRQDIDTSSSPEEMQRVDADNTEFLRSLIAELGWIDATRFGAPASDAAFLMVQHTSDLRLMRTALPHIERDVRAGLIAGGNYALLFDRLQLNLGYLQRYGSQIGVQEGVNLLMPCEDIERVDELRAEMGLGPLGEYLDYFRKEGDAPIRHIGRGLYGGE
jgi:hypothetical protein